MATAIQVAPSEFAYRDAPAHRVYTKARWSDSWSLQQYVYCNKCMFAAAPNISQAELYFRAGDAVQPDTNAYASYSRKDILRHFVKIEIDAELTDTTLNPDADKIVWVGQIVEQDSRRDNATDGPQIFTAFGLEHLLAKAFVNKAIIGVGQEPQATFVIEREVAFNGNTGDFSQATLAQRGNRTAAPGPRGVYVFPEDIANGEPWQRLDVIEYLLAYFAPGVDPELPDNVMEWKVDKTDGAEASLAVPAPTLRTEGRTVKGALDDLIDRRRLTGYRVEVDEDDVNKPIYIKPFSFTPEPVELPDGGTLEANTNQRTLAPDNWKDAAPPQVRESIAAKYDRVICRGGRFGVVFTLSYEDDRIADDWTGDEEDEYETAASGESGYDALNAGQKVLWNKTFREREELAGVWRFFKLPDNWDGTVSVSEVITFGVPPEDEPAIPLLPNDPEDKMLFGQVGLAPFWQDGLRFINKLPLKAGFNYRVVGNEDTEHDPPRQSDEFLRPFCLIRQAQDTTKWQFIDNPAETTAALGGISRRPAWSARLRMQPDRLGFILDVQDSQPGGGQHRLARGGIFWAGTDVDIPESEVYDILANGMLVTLYLYTDQYAQHIYPEVPFVAPDVIPQDLVIDFGDRFRCDYIVPWTIIGLEKDQTPAVSLGGLLRDDRKELAALSRLAYEWYSRDRAALSITVNKITAAPAFKVGDLITTLGTTNPKTVNSVVTQVTYDLLSNKTFVQTDYGELDVGALV